MNSLQLFLTHAAALEDESADRYEELSDNMKVHHNAEVSELFARMAHYSRLHRDHVLALVSKETDGLLDLKPWEYQWPGRESPESANLDASHYLMTPYHALRLALDAERMARDFYADVARQTSTPRVRELAEAFAQEEAEHAAQLGAWLERYPAPPADWNEDPDPPRDMD